MKRSSNTILIGYIGTNWAKVREILEEGARTAELQLEFSGKIEILSVQPHEDLNFDGFLVSACAAEIPASLSKLSESLPSDVHANPKSREICTQAIAELISKLALRAVAIPA
jgi:hypothetical protein